MAVVVYILKRWDISLGISEKRDHENHRLWYENQELKQFKKKHEQTWKRVEAEFRKKLKESQK